MTENKSHGLCLHFDSKTGECMCPIPIWVYGYSPPSRKVDPLKDARHCKCWRQKEARSNAKQKHP